MKRKAVKKQPLLRNGSLSSGLIKPLPPGPPCVCAFLSAHSSVKALVRANRTWVLEATAKS